MPHEPTGSREAFRGSLIWVEVERWPDPDRRREIVRHPGAAAIVAITPGRRVILIRQFREALRRPLLELRAGILDVAGEASEATARRELEEEAGYLAGPAVRLGTIHTSPGFADETIELFLAEAERTGEPEPGIEVVELDLDAALVAIDSAEITDAKTVAGLLLARFSRAGRDLFPGGPGP